MILGTMTILLRLYSARDFFTHFFFKYIALLYRYLFWSFFSKNFCVRFSLFDTHIVLMACGHTFSTAIISELNYFRNLVTLNMLMYSLVFNIVVVLFERLLVRCSKLMYYIMLLNIVVTTFPRNSSITLRR